MKTSIIRYRVADFLKQSAPFDSITEEDLLELAATGRVSFHEADEFVFRKNQQRKPFLWVIQQGTVEIIDEAEGGNRIRDLLGSGDLLGLGYLLGTERYLHSAKTATDVILYSIDARSFSAQVTKYPRVARFLAAHFSVSALYKDVLQSTIDEGFRRPGYQSPSWLDAEGPPVEFLRPRLRVCAPGQSLGEAARKMSDTPTDALAVVDGNGVALGLITRRELHDRLAGVKGSPEDACESIMRTGFQTAPANLTAEAYLLQMMRSRSAVLAITRDGCRESPLEGLLTDRELSCFTGRNPPQLLAELLHVRTSAERKALLRQARSLEAEVLTGPATFDRVAELASLFGTALAESIVGAAQDEAAAAAITAAAPVRYCWLLFGPAGRAEWMEPLQPEIGVVYADPPADRKADVARYFDEIGEKVSLHFAACGLDRQGQASGDRQVPRLRSLSDWKLFFQEIITNPIENEIYAMRRFLDFRVLCGDLELERELSTSIHEELKRNRQFIPILANDTMEHLPPMTFFRGLVIELDGARKETLDLGVTALGPIIDAARVYSLAAGDLNAKGTLERLDRAAATAPEAAAVFREAAAAFRVASYYAAAAAMSSASRSPLIEPSQLTKYDQRLLKTAFESVQKLIELTSTPAHWKQRM
jgi:CBS domain-containing protein